jgi:hypothetical protein
MADSKCAEHYLDSWRIYSIHSHLHKRRASDILASTIGDQQKFDHRESHILNIVMPFPYPTSLRGYFPLGFAIGFFGSYMYV